MGLEMIWNWQQPDWPKFKCDSRKLAKLEADFLQKSGALAGTMLHISENDKDTLRVQLISEEAFKTSEIEGEYLNRDSLQSSIRRNFVFLC